MSRLCAGPRAATATATALPRPRQATPRQPVRAGVPVYLQRVAADAPARARIAEQVQSQVQRADATTVRQASQAMASLADPAGASGAVAGGSGLGAGAATAATASAPTLRAAGAGVGVGAGRPQAGTATADVQGPGIAAGAPTPGVAASMQAPGIAAGMQTPGVNPLQHAAVSGGGPATAGGSAAEVGRAEGAGQAGFESGAAAASAAPAAGGAGAQTGEGAVAQTAEGTGAQAAEGAGADAQPGAGAGDVAAGGAGAGSAGPAGTTSVAIAGGEPAAAVGVASAATGAGELATGDLVLIDIELAEHERWAGALGRVGEVASVERAGFIAEQVGSGFIGGAASGAAMGLGIGLVTRVVPAIGPAIGGAMALHGLVTRDWAATGATIGRFGEGNDTYEVLANTLASVSAVIDVVSGVLSVINGIVGVVQLAAIGIAAGATVLAFFTFGATAGVAIAAGELAVVCEEITVAINIVTGALDMVNAAVLSPCITLFRALHSFTADADPREVEANGADISSAAAASGAALGAWAGGRAAAARPRGGRQEAPPPTRRPPHETPPAAAGDGPVVRYTPAAGPAAADAPAGAAPAAPHPGATAAAPHPVSAAMPEGLSAAAAPVLPVPVAAGHADTAAAAAAGGTGGAGGGGAGAGAGAGAGGGGGGGGSSGGTGGGGGHGSGPAVDPVLTGRRPEAGGMVIHEFGRPGIDTLQHLDVDATVAALDPHAPGGPTATSDTFFELPAGRDVPAAPGSATTAPTLPPHGLQDVEIRMNPDPTRIQYHENMGFEGVTHARVAEHGDVAITERGTETGAPGRPHTAGSVLPDDPSRVTTSAVPVRAPPSPRAGEPFPVEVRLHSANPSPGLAASAPHAHSRFNPTTQVNTSNNRYLLPDGRWVPQNSPDIGPAHYPVGGRDRGPAGLGEVPGIPGGVPTPPGSGGPPSSGGPGPGGAGPAPGGAGPAGPASAASASTAPAISGAAASSTGPLPAPAGASWTVAAREARRVVADASANAAGAAAQAATAAGGAAAVAGTAPAAAPSVGWGERAHQAGALFLPQFFGPSGPAPTYAEQRAAHRARFSADNQPAEGVERVNPHYTAPPATPAQIVEVQNQILNLLSVRALAQQEAGQQADRAAACEDNAGPIAATVADTAASQTALAEHQAAVARREAANQAQQQRQTEAGGLMAGYESRATGLAALEVPLTAWRGFTSLASHLPGSAGDRMAEMNREADTMQDALTEMGSQMLGSDAAQPAQAAALEGDAGVLSATVGQAQASGGELQTSADGAAGLQSANQAALAEARRREGAAEQREGQLGDAAAEREQRADTLAEQLQQWAQQHGAQRGQAVAATTERLQAEGHAVTGSSEP